MNEGGSRLAFAIGLAFATGIVLAVGWVRGNPVQVRIPSVALARPSEPLAIPEPASPPPQASPAASHALRLSHLLASPESKDMGEGDYLPNSAGETGSWEARESLKDSLARDPESWRDVLDLLASSDNLALGLQIVAMARPSVNDRAELVLIQLLKSRSHPESRQLVVAALAKRDSTAALEALQSTAAGDDNAGVRLAALYAVVGFRDRRPSPELCSAVNDFLLRRARDESEPQVRDPARRLCGEEVTRAVAQPPPPVRRRIFSFADTTARDASSQVESPKISLPQTAANERE